MGLIREPKNVDFTVQSQPWTEVELHDFRKLMTKLKIENSKKQVSRKGVTETVLRKKVIASNHKNKTL